MTPPGEIPSPIRPAPTAARSVMTSAPASSPRPNWPRATASTSTATGMSRAPGHRQSGAARLVGVAALPRLRLRADHGRPDRYVTVSPLRFAGDRAAAVRRDRLPPRVFTGAAPVGRGTGGAGPAVRRAPRRNKGLRPGKPGRPGASRSRWARPRHRSAPRRHGPTRPRPAGQRLSIPAFFTARRLPPRSGRTPARPAG